MQINRSRLGCGSRFNILRLWALTFLSRNDWHVITPLFSIGRSNSNVLTGELEPVFAVSLFCRWRPARQNFLLTRAWTKQAIDWDAYS